MKSAFNTGSAQERKQAALWLPAQDGDAVIHTKNTIQRRDAARRNRTQRLVRRFVAMPAMAIALCAALPAAAQQGSTALPFPGLDGTPAQTNCVDMFSPCAPGASAQTGLSRDANSSFDLPQTSGTFDNGGARMNNNDFDMQSPLQQQNSQDRFVNPSVPSPTIDRKVKEEPPNEFQLFVANATGKLLPIFGSQLFLNVPTTFAPLDKGPVTPDYVLGPGDELLLHAWGSLSFNLREHIDRDGNLYLPHFGEVRIAGLKYSELNQFLTARIGQEFRKFELSVSLGQLRSIQVLVVGRARRPGSYTVSSLSTLVNVLFASGGPASTGSMRSIELRRGGKTITTLDLYQLLAEGNESKDAPLLPGDVIYIPSAGPRIAIAGSISQPAIYEIHPGDTIADALNLAGGTTSIAALQRASLERIEGGVRHVTDVALNADGSKLPLTNGDVLHVFQIVPKFDNSVILRGNVANPGRYAWHDGMRISDLIPDKESLLTRNYWNGRNALALTDEERARARRIQTAARTREERTSQQQTSGRDNNSPSASMDNNSSSANNNSSPANANMQGKGGDAMSARMDDGTIPADEANTENQPGHLTNPEDQTPSSANSTGRSIAFDTGKPSEEFPRKNIVELTAPEINWDYAVVERTSQRDLTTSLKSFHLGRVVLDHDDSENYTLQPGDVVTVFSQADMRVPRSRQKKIVRLEGEFDSAGVYTVEPGETLRDLVKRAGGLTGDAYLFGSSLTRRSTRAQEQARLDQYTTDLEEQIDSEAGRKASTIINPQEAMITAASIENQRVLVTKLRQMQATGRIVLSIDPKSNDLSSIPEIPLEDGDVFVVPPRPSSIATIGAVYDQNSFAFEPGGNVSHYLQLSGGVAKNGDWKHSFVIRADGSVVSYSSLLAHQSHGLDHFGLEPGDAIIVPEQLSQPTLMRGLTDWSQIFAQFGLGAAAINVLH
jgi:polysaccharide export outer membrane protein